MSMCETHREEVFFHTLRNDSCGMLPEATEETGSEFRKITDKFRDENLLQ